MNRIFRDIAGLCLTLALFLPLSVNATTLNGFRLSDPLIPADQILRGGPPRDGIPAIDRPEFIKRSEATYLKDNDRILGLSLNGTRKAYPIAIMNWHEIVNDRFGRQSVAITYCPLCGTGLAFDTSKIGTLGVSGLLYNSDVLLYDRRTESLWSQILMQAVAGKQKGQRLKPLLLTHTTWKAWRSQHPDTLVLSRKTGYMRDYDRDPYLGYASSRRLYFPVANRDNRYHAKEWVVGVEVDGHYKAYPFSELEKVDIQPVKDRFQGTELQLLYDHTQQTVIVTNQDQIRIPAIQAFWFAWVAFHPDTEVFTVKP
ncbi:MAG: DUF3179 domain-containing protein [Gammaproteobacteria bacterium]|nr:MAG: DUF3179 domain-containing protein [Gammaproteobacteria bacterium]